MMSSVANNHGAFGQQSLIPPQKSSPSGAIPMAFYKRDSVGVAGPDCYPLDVSSMRPRHPDYTAWPPLSNSSQWTDAPCDPTAPHVGSLPAAHSLLSHPPKSNASTTSTSVMTNQNGKTFTAPVSNAAPLGAFPRYEDQHHHYSPAFPLKRGSSYSGPRPAYLDNSTAGAIPHMEYADGQGDPYHTKSSPAFQPLTPDLQYNAYRYGGTREKLQIANNDLATRSTKMSGRFQPGESIATSPPGSLASSDAETTDSSSVTRGASSLPVTGAISTPATSVIGAGSVVSQPKRPRKPAPTLATGRRNLKSETVDPDEADRRMKRRERNRKSAQKCRERKLHKTQELQIQVESLHLETTRLLREVDLWRDYCRKCVALLHQHCPGVSIPVLNCVVDGVESYLPPGPANNVTLMNADSLSFGDSAEQPNVNFYNKIQRAEGYGVISSTNSNTVTTSAAGISSNAGGWNRRAFPQITPQLPPLSQFVPIPSQMPTASSSQASLPINVEPRSSNHWNGAETIGPFLAEGIQESRETEWKTENDTDSSSGCGAPPRLNSPNEANKSSMLSSSL